MRQMNFDVKMDEVSRKPQSHITQEDAREIQSSEVSGIYHWGPRFASAEALV